MPRYLKYILWLLLVLLLALAVTGQVLVESSAAAQPLVAAESAADCASHVHHESAADDEPLGCDHTCHGCQCHHNVRCDCPVPAVIAPARSIVTVEPAAPALIPPLHTAPVCARCAVARRDMQAVSQAAPPPPSSLLRQHCSLVV